MDVAHEHFLAAEDALHRKSDAVPAITEHDNLQLLRRGLRTCCAEQAIKAVKWQHRAAQQAGGLAQQLPEGCASAQQSKSPIDDRDFILAQTIAVE